MDGRRRTRALTWWHRRHVCIETCIAAGGEPSKSALAVSKSEIKVLAKEQAATLKSEGFHRIGGQAWAVRVPRPTPECRGWDTPGWPPTRSITRSLKEAQVSRHTGRTADFEPAAFQSYGDGAPPPLPPTDGTKHLNRGCGVLPRYRRLMHCGIGAGNGKGNRRAPWRHSDVPGALKRLLFPVPLCR